MLRFQLFCICIFILLWKWKAVQGESSQSCPDRNVTAAAVVNRRCRKPCIKHKQCSKDRKCLCGHECGLSCISPEKTCKHPKSIKKMDHVQVYRKNPSGNYVPLKHPPYKFDDMARYVCKQGYVLDNEGMTHLCHGRGGWTNKRKSICIRSCRARDDDKVTANRMICGKECKQDSDCTSQNQCLCDGHCGRTCVDPDVDCGVAPPSNHSTIKYRGLGFSRVAYYSCDEGYFISSGSTSRKCTGGGTWEGQPISCQPVTCLSVTASMENMGGEVVNNPSGPYYVGTSITVRCRGYHKHIGAKIRTCMSNGRWSGVDTICERKLLMNSKPSCRHPGSPIGGRSIPARLSYKKFGVGEKVKFECDDYLVMVGKAEQECLYFYEWSGGGAPQCVDPRFRDSSQSALGKISESAQNIQSTLPSPGRFIGTQRKTSHEIYFLFDLSDSVDADSLNNSLTFAVKLIQRLTANASGVIEYGVMVFASEPEVIIDTVDRQPKPEEVIQKIIDIGLNRDSIQKRIRKGTHTDKALRTLASQIAFSYINDGNETTKERHVFILTDGKHNEGAPPQRQVDRMRTLPNPPTFYSITSCVKCASKNQGDEAYKELLGLAGGKLENYIYIENFYVISELLDRITDASLDLSKCGQAGDIGSVKLQARPGRVIGGARVGSSTRAWPWQIMITLYDDIVFKSYVDRVVYGGGTLIHNQWVLTAAHLFDYIDDSVDGWEKFFLLTFGIHKRPTGRRDEFPAKVVAFKAQQIIRHSKYDAMGSSPFDFDVALIKIGQEYEQKGTKFRPASGYGWVNYTEYIRPVCLPCMEGNCVGEYLLREGILSGDETKEEKCKLETDFLLKEGNVDGVLAVSTGFGHTANRTHGDNRAPIPSVYLKQGLHRIRTDDFCKMVTEKWLSNRWGRLTPISYTDTMLCATSGILGQNIDSCQGDSGGPMVTELRYKTEKKEESCWIQIGIVSWGWGCGQSIRVDGGLRQVPGFYTNVMEVSSWINTTIEEN